MPDSKKMVAPDLGKRAGDSGTKPIPQKTQPIPGVPKPAKKD